MTKTEAQRRAQTNYAIRNKDKLKQNNLEYRKRNPEICLLRAARNRALKSGIECSISKEDIQIPKYCPILLIELERKYGSYGGQDSSPSLDRIDNSKGYIKGNVWVVSQKANAMKSSASPRELRLFSEWIRKTYD